MSLPLRIFIGWDKAEIEAFHVLSHSILRHASIPVSITPVAKHHLIKVYTRQRGQYESTDFSLTRFLVPYLSEYKGYSVFMDCDMLCRVDMAHLLETIKQDDHYAVWCCQHDYTPKTGTKFLGQPQTAYPRKNWSSFMVFDNGQCRALTPDYVNQATGLELHRFAWVRDRDIGSLPLAFNWLADEYEFSQDALMVHYTRGGPWFSEYANTDYAQDWRDERELMRGVIHPEMVA